MRLISLILTLALIGFFLIKQFYSGSLQAPESDSLPASVPSLEGDVVTPNISSSPTQLKRFETEVNQFVQDNADKRAKAIEQAENE